MEYSSTTKKNLVAVLISTYNGAKYIQEQLDSIYGQKGRGDLFEVEVFIRDDGSEDETLNLIRKYYPEAHILRSNQENIGPKNSFFSLLGLVQPQFDLYFFSDQDDVWIDSKIVYFLEAYDSKKNKSVPIGMYSDLWIADASAHSTGVSMAESFKWKDSFDFKSVVWDYRITGASFAINQSALMLFKKISLTTLQTVNMHDSFLGLFIATVGDVVQINKPLVMYRQHASNVIGATNKNAGFRYRLKRLLNTGVALVSDVKVVLESIDDIKYVPINTNRYNYIQSIANVLAERNPVQRVFGILALIKDVPRLKYKIVVLIAALKRKDV